MENDQPMKEKDLEIFKTAMWNPKTQNQDTGQIPSPEKISSDQTTSQTNSEKTGQDMDEHMPDQTQTMNWRSRKSAEEEYDEIQKKANKNP